MKKLILGISLMASTFIFAQKEDVNAKLQAANKSAMDAYNAKNYTVAAPKFFSRKSIMSKLGIV